MSDDEAEPLDPDVVAAMARATLEDGRSSSSVSESDSEAGDGVAEAPVSFDYGALGSGEEHESETYRCEII